jgi:Predicted enzyme related to lactoylglutathione lyase
MRPLYSDSATTTRLLVCSDEFHPDPRSNGQLAFKADNPMNYGIVDREDNVNADGIGIGGGVGGSPEYPSHVTFYVEVPDVEAALAKAESLGGTRMMGPDKVTEGVEIGLFTDPDGLLIGVIKATS